MSGLGEGLPRHDGIDRATVDGEHDRFTAFHGGDHPCRVVA